ncbi:MAG: hypothetical protein KF752_19625 [Pirellulaceae bacterium]|nr:hypothetical protein [Pirellulaceae bacterium]
MTDLRQLIDTSQKPCVTILTPTHLSGPNDEQDIVRLKNLVKQAEDELSDGWLAKSEAHKMLAPLRDIPEDHEFWAKRSCGLALFLDQSGLRRFRVPISLDELVVVGTVFHVKSLLPLIESNRYLILVLSQHSVRLFEAGEHQIKDIVVADLPQRMEESLNLVSVDGGSQSHFAMKAGKGKETSVFHGQGGKKDTHKEELIHFFRMIDNALQPILRDESAPLVLAGVDYLLAQFRQVSRYPHIAVPELRGNCDRLSAEQIHQKVWPLVKPLLIQERQLAVEKFNNLAGTGLASDELGQLLLAAFYGRIETLFIAPKQYQWGTCDMHGRIVAVHGSRQPGDDDLTEIVAVQTLLHGGKVYAVAGNEMPSTQHAAAAVMRY